MTPEQYTDQSMGTLHCCACRMQGLRAMVTGIVACAIYLSLEKTYGFSLVFTDWYYQQNTFMRMLVMQVGGDLVTVVPTVGKCVTMAATSNATKERLPGCSRTGSRLSSLQQDVLCHEGTGMFCTPWDGCWALSALHSPTLPFYVSLSAIAVLCNVARGVRCCSLGSAITACSSQPSVCTACRRPSALCTAAGTTLRGH